MENFFEILKVIILGIIQGITEWLPISSTGHMILVDEFLKLNQSEAFMSTFFVVIQFGSILAVLLLFFKKLNPLDSLKTKQEKDETISLWLKVIIAIIPSGLIGVLFEEKIDELFFNPTTVAIALITYGIIMIILEYWQECLTIITDLNDILTLDGKELAEDDPEKIIILNSFNEEALK